MSRSLRIVRMLLTGLGALLAACMPNSAGQTDPPWRYADVRSLDAVDAGLPAECDLIAAYMRSTDDELQLRLDFLAPASRGCDLWITANGQSGGQRSLPDGSDPGMAWDILLTFSSDSQPTARFSTGADAPFIPRIIADPDSASVVIHINRRLLPFRPQQMLLSAFSRMNDRTVDSISMFSLNDSPPPRAPMLWEFTSVLQPDTARTARAGWDAAHAGPAGSRFGLRHLLQAALDARVPITLLDLRRPTILSALDALGGMDTLSRLQTTGLLLAPDVVSSAAGSASASRDLDRRISQSLGIPPSAFTYGNLAGSDLHANATYFAVLPDSAHLATLDGSRLIPLPSAPTTALDANGITTDALRRLLSAALSADPDDLVVFHEAMPDSFAGDAHAVARGMIYLAAHPWIQPLSAADLQTWPVRPLEQWPCATLLCAAAPAPSTSVEADLPVNSAGQWARILAQDSPSSSSDLSLRAAHIAGLTLAARWLANPQPIAACGLDLDQNQREDCLLANDQILLAASAADPSPTIVAMRKSAMDTLTLLFTPLPDSSAVLSTEITPTQIRFHAPDGSLHSRWAIQSAPPTLVLDNQSSDLTLTFTAAGMQRFTSGWAQRFAPRSEPGGWRLGPLSIVASSPAATLECGFAPLDRLRQPQNPESADPAAFGLPLDSCQLRVPARSITAFKLVP